MKFQNFLIAALLTIACFIAVTYTACKKDSCKEITCQNGGTCTDGKCVCPSGYGGDLCDIKTDACTGIKCKNEGVCKDGTCVCPAGFEGALCELLSINKYIGAWIGKDSCSQSAYPADTVTIGASAISHLAAVISNPAGVGHQYSVTGYFTGTDSINIPAQSLATGISLSGTIVFSGTTAFKFHYVITSATVHDTCSGVYTK